jgi:hypothetical protein
MSETSEDRFEQAYEMLAAAIDRAGAANESLFLAKLVLLLANRLDDPSAFAGMVEAALEDLQGDG